MHCCTLIHEYDVRKPGPRTTAMTLVQLQHFLTLARVGSFVRAAELAHLTQPALSRSIKALEDELGQLLFDRIGRRIALTPFGLETRRRAQLLLEDAQELKGSGRQIESGARGRFRLGLGSGPGALFTTPLLTRMAREFPRFHLEISRANTDTLVRLLRERELDALIVDARWLKPAPDLALDHVFEARGAFMCRPGHPLLASGQALSFAQLLQFPVASTPLSDELARLLVERYGEQAHPQEMVTLSSDEISHLVEAAQETDTIVLAIRAAAPNLVELELAPPFQTNARFGLVTVAGRAQSVFLPEIGRLVQTVRDGLGDG
jgi:DNA-binding transcriptional LysR family regulator